MSYRNGAAEPLGSFLCCRLDRSKNLLVNAVEDEDDLKTFVTPATLSYEIDVAVLALCQEGKFPLHCVDAAQHTAPDPWVQGAEYRVSNEVS